MHAQWVGPIPPPNVLHDYSVVVKDGAERLFVQFEAEANHRRRQEDRDSRLKQRAIHVGQGLAGAYAAAAFGLTGYATHETAYTAAAVLGGTTLVSGITAFLGFAKKPRRRE